MYFLAPLAAPPLAQRANVDRASLIKLAPGADPINVAGMFNPLSVAAGWRYGAVGREGAEGRTVFILGATSASVTVKVALGAAKIIGDSRNAGTLARVEGLDERVVLQEPLSLPGDIGPIHVMLDFVGGPAAIALLEAIEVARDKDLQYVHVGGLSGEKSMALPLDLRLSVVGSGMGSWSMEDVRNEIPGPGCDG